jgi:hypothetical protein
LYPVPCFDDTKMMSVCQWIAAKSSRRPDQK